MTAVPMLHHRSLNAKAAHMTGFADRIGDNSQSSPPLLRQRWQTINNAHAVQRAVVVVSFPEEVPSLMVKRMADAVRQIAHQLGLVKEEPVQTVLIQIGPGGIQQPGQASQEGVSFQRTLGANVIQSLNITKDAVRIETLVYTRWLALREQVKEFLSGILPIVAQAVQIKTVGLEYFDFFYAVTDGPEDAGLIIDRGSECLARKAFRKRTPFHSHAGWFEDVLDGSQKLVNVDVTVADSNGPVGLRRTVTIRTYEAEQVTNLHGRGAELTVLEQLLNALDALHASHKTRLGGILTREAKNMISLGA